SVSGRSTRPPTRGPGARPAAEGRTRRPFGRVGSRGTSYTRPMADTSLASVRVALVEERDRLRQQIRDLGRGESGDFDENFADSGQVTAERGEADALTGQLVETLGEIEEALAKLDGGTYGVCESCHQMIGEARLVAMPAARLCITCASKRR